MNTDERWAHNRALNSFAESLARLQIPTVAAINGLAFGGGFEISLACDFRIAADHAALALAYAKAAVDLSIETSLGQGLRFETTAIRATLASEDYQAGLAAFAERRPPEFPPLTARRIT